MPPFSQRKARAPPESATPVCPTTSPGIDAQGVAEGPRSPFPVTVTITPVIAPLPDDVPVVLDAIANKTPTDLLEAIQRTTAAATHTPRVSDRASRSGLPLERRLMEDLQYAGVRNARVTHLERSPCQMD